MRFGRVATEEAEGAVLAHSLRAPGIALRKGRVLSTEDIAALRARGVGEVVVSQLDASDVGEDAAALRLGRVLGAEGLRLTEPFAGRVNLISQRAGILRVSADAVHTMNAVDEAITLATLPDYARVSEGALVATIKIIPYGVAGPTLAQACTTIPKGALALHPFLGGQAELVLTRTAGMKDSVLAKGRDATQARLVALGMSLSRVCVVEHEVGAVAAALGDTDAGLILFLTGSATSDRRDVAPAALIKAGGRITRFGMPVDPGNLLFLGELGGRKVIGLPGCARSPALNGADWVLERLAAGLPVEGADIARMGVGGLLKEIPERVQPRRARPLDRPGTTEVILLAAGASLRMGGKDKLLRAAGAEPLLRRAARAALGAGAAKVHVVLPPGADARQAALEGLSVSIVEAPDWGDGMSASLRAGVAALSPDCGAAIVTLADMPDLTPAHYEALISARAAGPAEAIYRATDASNTPGHPVMFPQRYFELLATQTGDAGARDVLRALASKVIFVPTRGEGARTDLDTPQDWEAWEQKA